MVLASRARHTDMPIAMPIDAKPPEAAIARAFDENPWRIGVVVVPPPEEGERQIDRDTCDLEPRRPELRLKAEPPGSPLGREPHRREHDRKDDEDLAPEDFGGGHLVPR